MSVNFLRLVELVEGSKAELDKAMGEFSDIDRMTLVETYVMGHIRAGLAVLQSAKDFIQQTQAYKDAMKKPAPKAVPKDKPAGS